jgi:hypothetical protein
MQVTLQPPPPPANTARMFASLSSLSVFVNNPAGEGGGVREANSYGAAT